MSQQFFAQLDDNNVVTKIAVVQQEFLEANPERYTGVWVETFFDTAGKQYAGIGYTYDADDDVFVAPQPYPSWTLDSNHNWQAPTPIPSTGGPYTWSEEDLEWVAV
jgi:hypothetical protein